ncbi:hypothetical protein BGW38_009204 [Lunasporangiospora selenospora]|uniref:HNH nuclease domain-containing protein n=1 Tax=Lunasporangiospora selenospora TaxID=979761 RepID=A0A9P6FXB4_9FUNG|nr:hypothetical protein BGW38_009204 [Lunasporangiospora selenospora]
MLRLSVTKTWSSQMGSSRTIPTGSLHWKRIRQEVLERDSYACRFCGVRARKFMVCDHFDGNPSHNDLTNLGINCGMCDLIRHCGLAGIRNLLALGISEMSQREINEKTLRLFRETNTIPLFKQVDSEVVMIDGSTIDYANELLRTDNNFDYSTECHCCSLPHTYDMHKGFFKRTSTYLLARIIEHQF